MLDGFWKDRSGNFAVITALIALPLLLAVGISIDTARHYAAQNHLQNIADNASLAAAVSREQDPVELRLIADHFIQVNLARNTLGSVAIDALDSTESTIELKLSGSIQATFMGLAGFTTLPVSATAFAEREVRGQIEVALVLDNTYSMILANASGKKIDSLKSAATDLINNLMSQNDGSIRIGIVPYADYVNVGVENRNASWLRIDDQDQPSCREDMVDAVCLRRSNSYPCEKTKDGVPYMSTCGGDCLEEQKATSYNPKRYICDTPKLKTWFGCVGSRLGGVNNLTDLNPMATYPGLIDVGTTKCPTPIVPLTDNKQRLLDAIDGMIVERQYYQPKTYIPIGLIWGQNVLSPVAPFSEGNDYDPLNRKPRKIMILMTDGANTMMYRQQDGHHGDIRGGDDDESIISADNMVVRRREQAETDAATRSICTYSKAQKIEIYTVAFMVPTEAGKKLMQDCATDAAHYFDAADRDKLLRAFKGIADSISRVRLAR